MTRILHRSVLPLIVLAALSLSCGGSGNPGAVFDPNPPGSGGGGGGGGGNPNGPSAAPLPGGLSVAGAPTVVSVAPKGESVSVESPIAITFSESVQATSVTSTSLVVRAQGGASITTTVSSFGGGRFFILTPNVQLPVNRTIEIVASNSILDLDGARLVVPAGGIIGTFKTELTATTNTTPSVIASFPPDGAKNVSPGTPGFGSGASAVAGTPTQIVYVFSEPIAPSTILGDATPPLTPDKIGLSLGQQFDPDGAGPLPPVNTPLLPGNGAVLLPFNENRVWVATPNAPLTPGATVALGVGGGAKSDDLTPVGVSPIFLATFTVAPFAPPTFVNIDVTPATATELSGAATVLNALEKLPDGDADPNNDPPNPNFAGNFTVGAVFGAGSLATDNLDIQLHDASSGAFVNFARKAKAGAGQLNYGDGVNGSRLSVLNTAGTSLLSQGSVVLAARVRRGTTVSAWTVGPVVTLDTIAPAIGTLGPPAEGATLFTSVRRAAVYGTVSEAPSAIVYNSIQSPVGTAVPIPAPSGTQGHLLRNLGNAFSLLPLIPAPAITATTGAPPEEPQAGATIQVSDAVGNRSPDGDPSPTVAGTPIRMVHRGRLGGPALASHDAITVVVYDKDTLQIVPTAVVLLDAAAPSGRGTSQVKRTVAAGFTGGVVAARFTAGADFPVGSPALTVTAAAPNYDITTFVGVPTSFVSIPIRRTASGASTADPSITVTLNNAPPGGNFDVIVNSRPELSDSHVIASTTTVGGIPLIPTFTVPAQRELFFSGFFKAGTSFSFTYLNDAITFPTLPLALGGSSSATIAFGQSYSQTTDISDDPVAVPPGGGVPVSLPGAPFNPATLVNGLEVALYAPGSLVGTTGMIGVGGGRSDSVSGSSGTVSLSFNPKINSLLFDTSGAAVTAAPLDPNAPGTLVTAGVRAQDGDGRITRSYVRTNTSGGSISGITLPPVPSTLAQISATGPFEAPKIRWTDVAPSGDGLYLVQLRMKQFAPIREWRVYVPRTAADLTVGGEAAIQLPSLVAFGTEVGAAIPLPGAKLDQLIEAIHFPGLDLFDFFFDDLRVGQTSPSEEDPFTIARGVSAEITY
ncbi:MAG: Ig-like domain-containing protein [Planctomycetes bacterium]|nr:Ig-like domain-containing protein [Planctomycetota bacterium]